MKKTIKDFNLENKKVIIRCDFNVPIKDGKIVDNNRIVESLKTIKYAVESKAKVILMSHLGKIKSEEDLEKNNLSIVASELSNLLEQNVYFINSTRGKELENKINTMNVGEVVLIQNTRYEDLNGKLESSNNEELGKYWASLGDIFINDAFATAHRSHASNVGIASYIPSGIGFLVEKEIEKLSVLNNPELPYVVILGGAKISDKIEIVDSLIKKANKILIGGGMAFTFLKSLGNNIGNSICDDESIDFAKSMLSQYREKIVLPIDAVVTKEFSDNPNNSLKSVNELENDDIGLDIGKETIELFKENLNDSKTVFWNGTLGYSEFKNYSTGTRDILDYVTSLDSNVILGGGDTVAASKVLGYYDKVSYASTGGGAALEYIAGKSLPGIEIIKDKEDVI